MQHKPKSFDTTDWEDIWRYWRAGPYRTFLSSECIPHVVSAQAHLKHWQARAAQLYYTTGFARRNRAVLDLGVMALGDRSVEVRYRACGLLAFSKNELVLPSLENLLAKGHSNTKKYARAAIKAIALKSIEPFTALDTYKRQFYCLPIRQPCRAPYPLFAETFDEAAGSWLRELGFEPQVIFQHHAYYRRGDLWFHACWEQWDVMWLFRIGQRGVLENRYIGKDVPDYVKGGTLVEVAEALSKEIPIRLQEYADKGKRQPGPSQQA